MVLENIRVTHDCYVQRLGIAAVHLQNNKKIVIINIFFIIITFIARFGYNNSSIDT